MLRAIAIVRPALEQFYNSLSDEQKARFNAINPEAAPLRTAGQGQRLPDLTQVCSGPAAKATDVPAERIEQALHPTESQRSALEALNAATAKAAEPSQGEVSRGRD
jgi:LTXXQ motif family protein